jgi:hypothetical protein
MVDTENAYEDSHPAHWVGPHPRAVRLRTVMAWAGLLLLALAGLALTMAGSWRAPDMMFMAGVYGGMGSLTLIASAFHT